MDRQQPNILGKGWPKLTRQVRWARGEGIFERTDPPHLGVKHGFHCLMTERQNRHPNENHYHWLIPRASKRAQHSRSCNQSLGHHNHFDPSPFSLSAQWLSGQDTAWLNIKYIGLWMWSSRFKDIQPWGSYFPFLGLRVLICNLVMSLSWYNTFKSRLLK